MTSDKVRHYLENNILHKKHNNQKRSYKISSIKKLLNDIGIEGNPGLLANRLYLLNSYLTNLLDYHITHPDNTYLNKLFGKVDTDIHNINQEVKKHVCNGAKVYRLVDHNYVQVGGFIMSDPDASTFTKVLDLVQLILDIAGFIPAAGIPIDIASLVLALLRAQWMDALFSAINIIPLVGSFIGTPLKYISKASKLKDVADAAKLVDKAMDAKKLQKFADKANDAKGKYDDAMMLKDALMPGDDGYVEGAAGTSGTTGVGIGQSPYLYPSYIPHPVSQQLPPYGVNPPPTTPDGSVSPINPPPIDLS